MTAALAWPPYGLRLPVESCSDHNVSIELWQQDLGDNETAIGLSVHVSSNSTLDFTPAEVRQFAAELIAAADRLDATGATDDEGILR